VISIVRPPKSRADSGPNRDGQALFWLGIGAAQKGAGSKPTDSPHPVISFVVGILLALLIGAGAVILLVSQQ
jgi:hypothetical protein